MWAIRHPGTGYVQGINDLVTPFFFVFLMEVRDSGGDEERGGEGKSAQAMAGGSWAEWLG